VKSAVLKTKRSDGKMVYEAAIPWKEIATPGPKAGEAVGFSFVIQENDGKSWKGYLEGYSGICGAGSKDKSRFGDLTFLKPCGAWPAAGSGSNLVGNPSFEEPLKVNGAISGWVISVCGSNATVKLDTKESYHGEKSLCVVNSSDKGMVLLESENKIPVNPGEQYVLTGYIKADMDSLDPDDSKKGDKKSAGFFIQGRTRGGGWGKTFGTKPAGATTTSTWIECNTGRFTIPEGTETICIRLVINGGNMRAWFDDISLIKVK